MGLMVVVAIAVGGLLWSALSRVLGEEFKAWRPYLVGRIITIAVGFLKQDERERYLEEFSAHVDEIPGDLGKLFVALGILLATTRTDRARMISRGAKRSVDFALALIALVILAPMMMAIVFLIYAFGHEGPLIRLRMIGKDGKQFGALKFVTFKKNAHGQRYRTPFGSLIVKNSLDELPQLINVLKGDMSLVGPRARRPHDVGRLESNEQKMRPGLTGISQIAGQDVLDDREKGRWEADQFYHENHSFWLDLKIMAATVVAVILGR